MIGSPAAAAALIDAAIIGLIAVSASVLAAIAALWVKRQIIKLRDQERGL